MKTRRKQQSDGIAARGAFDMKDGSSRSRTWRHTVDLGDGRRNQMTWPRHSIPADGLVTLFAQTTIHEVLISTARLSTGEDRAHQPSGRPCGRSKSSATTSIAKHSATYGTGRTTSSTADSGIARCPARLVRCRIGAACGRQLLAGLDILLRLRLADLV